VKREEFEAQQSKVREAIFKYDPVELQKEHILAYTRANEKHMYNFKKEMHARMPTGTPEIPINIHQEIIRIEAIQCGDLIFNKFGIESRDVVPSMIKLGLLNDEEIREVIQGYHSMFEGFLRQKAFEADQNV